jgi:membrane protein DedA with SNARE-associated domain
MTEAINHLITTIMDTIGAPGTALLIALESIFPPIPSEVVLLSAGFAANQGDLNLIAAIIWTTVGSVVGALVLYYLGAWLGRERVRKIALKMPLVKVDDVDKTEKWFQKHDTKAVFFGRMIPLFRSFISIPAGIERMDVKRFIIYTAAGSLIWNTLFLVLGYKLGENWEVVEKYVGYIQYAIIAAIAAFAVYWVQKRLQRH